METVEGSVLEQCILLTERWARRRYPQGIVSGMTCILRTELFSYTYNRGQAAAESKQLQMFSQ